MPIEEVVISSPPVGVRELLDLALDQVVEPVAVHSIVVPVGASMTPSTTPPASEVWSDQPALVAGVFTLDLTSLVGSNLAAKDFTGLKVQIFQFSNPESNANNITITPGVSNDYDLMGAGMSNTLAPGDMMLLILNGSGPVVGASDAELDFLGTGTEVMDLMIVAG